MVKLFALFIQQNLSVHPSIHVSIVHIPYHNPVKRPVTSMQFVMCLFTVKQSNCNGCLFSGILQLLLMDLC